MINLKIILEKTLKYHLVNFIKVFYNNSMKHFSKNKDKDKKKVKLNISPHLIPKEVYQFLVENGYGQMCRNTSFCKSSRKKVEKIIKFLRFIALYPYSNRHFYSV